MAEMLMKAQKYMNAEDALAIKDVENLEDKGEERRMITEDKKGSVQTDESMTGVKGKTRKLPKRKIHSSSYAYW